jgi:hypothetical protein
VATVKTAIAARAIRLFMDGTPPVSNRATVWGGA